MPCRPGFYSMTTDLGSMPGERTKGHYLNSKRIYSANGIFCYFFPRISAFTRRTKMHLNGILLVETEFFKIIVPL